MCGYYSNKYGSQEGVVWVEFVTTSKCSNLPTSTEIKCIGPKVYEYGLIQERKFQLVYQRGRGTGITYKINMY